MNYNASNPQNPYNEINPNAFSGKNNINGVFGQAMPGTFNRNVPGTQQGVVMDPLTGNQIDPTMAQNTTMPIAPPNGVQTPITPTYDLNNQ